MEFDIESQLTLSGDEGARVRVFNKLHLKKKIGKDTGVVLKFKKGLRGIERMRSEDQAITTRLYPYGASKNLPHPYRSGRPRLSLPEGYIEKNIHRLGLIEGVKLFEEVYPKREGTVSFTSEKDPLSFTDESMDFDLNDHLVPGSVAKLTFNSGELSGYEMDIDKYNNTKKSFELIAFDDGKGNVRPDERFKIKTGDKYVLHDIYMPKTYVEKAERELREKAFDYLDKYSKPTLTYSVSSDYVYLRRNLINFNVGDVIVIEDEDFALSLKTRIVSLSQSLLNPYEYQIKLSDEVNVSYVTKLLDEQHALRDDLRFEKKERKQEILRGSRRLGELKASVFDSEGYFDSDHIKPLSIETGMLSVGAKGTNFIIEGLLLEPNYGGNPNVANLSDAELTHFTLEEKIKSWSIQANSFSLDQENSLYYIYAICAKGSNGGLWHVSQERIKTEDLGDHYFFLLGVIHSVMEGVRGVSLTYGQSAINGRFITTGRIKSVDGNNFMDLDQNQFSIGNETSGIDWNKSEKDTLTIKGAIIQKGSVADWVINEGKITSRDKLASLNSQDGRFSIIKDKNSGEKIELSKEGLYAGHAGINMKDTHGKDIKAAVVGRKGKDASNNSLGGFFEGIRIDGAVHLNTKIIKDQDLIKSESYPREIYKQPAKQPAYDKQRVYEDPYWDVVFNPPAHIDDLHPDYTGRDHRKRVIEQGGPFSFMEFPEPEANDQKDNWVKQAGDETLEKAMYGTIMVRGYIRAPEKGKIEVSALWASGSKVEGKLGLFLNDEKTPRKSLSTLHAEVINKNYNSQEVLYRFYMKDIEVKKGDRIYFKETTWGEGELFETLIYLIPEGRNRFFPYYYGIGPCDTFVMVGASRTFGLFLPEHPQPGRIIKIKHVGAPHKIYSLEGAIYTSERKDFIEMNYGETRTFIYTDMWHTIN